MVNRIELLFANRHLAWLSIGTKIKMSYALRHAPREYELELDENGFVPTKQLLFSLDGPREYGRDIAKEDLEYVIPIPTRKGTRSLKIK